MPRRVPAALAVEDLIEVEGKRYIVLEHDPLRPHLFQLFDAEEGAPWPLDPETGAPIPFDIAAAARDGVAWRLIRDADQIAAMVERVLEIELVLDPQARAIAEERMALIADIREQREILVAEGRARARRRRAAHKAGVAPAPEDEDAGAAPTDPADSPRAGGARPPRSSWVRERLHDYCVARHGISSSTYYRWEQQLEEAGGSIAALLDARDTPITGARSVSARAGSKLTDQQRRLAAWAYDNHYANKPEAARSIKFAHEKLVEQATKTHQKPLGKTTLWAIILGLKAGERRPLDAPEIPVARTKATVAAEARGYYETIWQKARFPGEYVFEDSHEIDLRGIDFRFRLPTMRLWYHSLFDAFSGTVPGWRLSIQGPSTQTLQLALMNAIFPRDYQAEFGVAAAHPYITPRHLIVDNAWGSHSHSLRAACNDIGRYGVNAISIVFRPPYEARRGALIERHYGKLEAEFMHRLLGSTFSHARQRAGYDPDDFAGYLFEDIAEGLVRWTDIYHNTPQARLLGLTPLERLREWEERMGPLAYPQDSRARHLFRVLHPEARVVDRQGFKLFGLRYNGPALDWVRSTPDTIQRPRIHARYDDEDVRAVSVYNNGKYLGEVPALNLPRRGDGNQAIALREWEWVKHEGPHQEVPDGRGGTRRIALAMSTNQMAALFSRMQQVYTARAAESAVIRRELERSRLANQRLAATILDAPVRTLHQDPFYSRPYLVPGPDLAGEASSGTGASLVPPDHTPPRPPAVRRDEPTPEIPVAPSGAGVGPGESVPPPTPAPPLPVPPTPLSAGAAPVPGHADGALDGAVAGDEPLAGEDHEAQTRRIRERYANRFMA